MSFCYPRRLALALAITAVLPAGCDEPVEVMKVPASEVVPPKTEGRVKREVVPRQGSSSGMRYNPGGPPPGANVD